VSRQARGKERDDGHTRVNVAYEATLRNFKRPHTARPRIPQHSLVLRRARLASRFERLTIQSPRLCRGMLTGLSSPCVKRIPERGARLARRDDREYRE